MASGDEEVQPDMMHLDELQPLCAELAEADEEVGWSSVGDLHGEDSWHTRQDVGVGEDGR